MYKQNIKYFLICIVFVCLPIAFYTSYNSGAQETTQIEYKVVQGDSLSKISNKFGVGIQDIKETNNLKNDLIYIGQILLIPDKKITKVEPAETQKETTTVSKEPAEDSSSDEPINITDLPRVSPDTLRFKWAFIARIDPLGRNEIINIAENAINQNKKTTKVLAGDKISLYFEPDQHTFIYLYLLDSRKNLEVLYPPEFDEKTLESTFVPGKGTYLPEKYEWFTFDENKGTETFYLLASSKRLDELERVTKKYLDRPDNKSKQLLISEIRGLKRKLAFNTKLEKPIGIGGIIRGLEIDIATKSVLIESEDFYTQTIYLDHE